MLEGDELLELAQETGYRLCHYPFETKHEGEEKQQHLVFSASWDVNPQYYRLFLCMQNGELKVVEFQEINSVHTFQIRFRHHVNNISDYHKTADKIIQLHFDKFSTITGKDDEILFLLGISKSIYHSKLPDIIVPPDGTYGEEDGTTDLLDQGKPPIYGYHLGSPVLELANHPTRVTALAVSWQGKYLASGDEAGHVKIIMLQTKDNMQQVITNEFQRMQQEALSGPVSSKLKELSFKVKTSTKSYLPKYDFTELLHDGPIFSLQWIHPNLTTDFNHSQGLLTGSLDRAVRLWGVSYSVSHGIGISPMMVFDTFSTHILSLHAFSSAMIAQKHQNPSDLSSAHPLLSTTASQKRDDEAVSVTSSQAMFNRVAHYSYIFAGTNAGTLHIWKIYDKEVMSAYERLNRERFDSTVTKTTTRGVLDDGKRLVNLIQVSEYPIIHISTGSMITTLTSLHNSFNGNVLLSVSDVHGQVRIYGTEYQSLGEFQINSENVNDFFSSKSRDNYETNPLVSDPDNYVIQKIRARHEKEFPFSYHSKHDDPNMEEGIHTSAGQLSIVTGDDDEMEEENDVDESFTPLKEEFFESPVVACSFSNAPPSSYSSGQGSGTGGGGSSAELAIVTMDAMIRLYNDVNEAKHARSKVTEITLKSLSGRSRSFASADPAMSPALRSSPRLDKIDSADLLKDKIFSDANSRKEILAAVSEDSHLRLSQHRLGSGGGSDDDMESRSSWHTSHYTRSDRGGIEVGDEQVQRLYEKTMMRKKRQESNKVQESKTKTDRSLSPSRGPSLNISSNKQLRQSDEFDPNPRSVPPPKPILANTFVPPSSSPIKRKASFVTITGALPIHLASTGQTITRRGSMMSVLTSHTSQSGESRGDNGVKYEEVEYPASDYLDNNFSLPALQSSKVSADVEPPLSVFSYASRFLRRKSTNNILSLSTHRPTRQNPQNQRRIANRSNLH